jgi:hypothetical protein
MTETLTKVYLRAKNIKKRLGKIINFEKKVVSLQTVYRISDFTTKQ